MLLVLRFSLLLLGLLASSVVHSEDKIYDVLTKEELKARVDTARAGMLKHYKKFWPKEGNNSIRFNLIFF